MEIGVKKDEEFIQKMKAELKEKSHTEGKEEYERRFKLSGKRIHKNKKKYSRKNKHGTNNNIPNHSV